MKTFANTLQLIPHAKLLLLGNSGQNKEIIEEWIVTHGLQKKILIRHASRTEVPKYCFAADIFTMHSEKEGYPLAMIEAMASGLPVVVPNLPFFREGVTDGIDGYIFPFSNTRMHAQMILKVSMYSK